MKFYFVAYSWTRPGINGWEKSNVVISTHPVEWFKQMIEEFSDTYRIDFYDEISKEQYELLDGLID